MRKTTTSLSSVVAGGIAASSASAASSWSGGYYDVSRRPCGSKSKIVEEEDVRMMAVHRIRVVVTRPRPPRRQSNDIHIPVALIKRNDEVKRRHPRSYSSNSLMLTTPMTMLSKMAILMIVSMMSRIYHHHQKHHHQQLLQQNNSQIVRMTRMIKLLNQ
jgi:hypothetical protein